MYPSIALRTVGHCFVTRPIRHYSDMKSQEMSSDMERSACIAIQWTKSQHAIWAFVLSLVPNYQQAEEIVQQVAVTIVEKYDDYEEARSFTSWALGIARYKVLKSRRRFSTDKHSFYPFDDTISEKLGLIYEEQAEEWGSHRVHMAECLKAMQGRSSESLRLRYSQGMDLKVLAKKLGVTSGAAYTILSRARDVLRRCVERRVAEEGGGS